MGKDYSFSDRSFKNIFCLRPRLITEINKNKKKKRSFVLICYYSICCISLFLPCTELSKQTETVLQNFGFRLAHMMGLSHCGCHKSTLKAWSLSLHCYLWEKQRLTKRSRTILFFLMEIPTQEVAFVLLSHEADSVNGWPYL